MSSKPCREGFGAPEAVRFTGCTPSQIRYWDHVGLVIPSLGTTQGKSGVRRCYSFEDLILLRSIKALLDAGVSLQRVRRAFAQLQASGLKESVMLSTDGSSVIAVDSAGVITDALKDGQLRFFGAFEAATVKPDETGALDRDCLAMRRAIKTVRRDLSGRRAVR